ncbi:hypothetical protein C8J57DRAFT_1274520 [Mycena rebaudengoi]|nr:hypothetical protein C8J57DRAFT_1274520 [Mycena rebaudengoi]
MAFQQPLSALIHSPDVLDTDMDQHLGEDGLYLLHSAIAIGASHDSVERYPPPRCHPQTRKMLFEIILAWLKNAAHGPRVLWLHGEAGAGKSAASQTVAEFCAQSGQLGATFFFSHGKGDLSDGRFLFPTIAYKLASIIPAMRAPLSRAIQLDTSVLSQSLDVQVQKLIIEPFRNVQHPSLPILIIIDGLDACNGHPMQLQILSLLAQLLVVHGLPLCFFITSRLQPHLEATFDTPVLLKLSNRVPLDVFNSEPDVRHFLRSEFSSIRQYHHAKMGSIAEPWPSDDVIDLLVQKSSGEFLYPATVVKYVDDKFGRPAERLIEVVVTAASDTNLSPVDQLYHHILSSSAASPTTLVRMMGAIVVLYNPLPPKEIEILLDLPRGAIFGTLRGIDPLVDAPEPSSPIQTVRIAQSSFVEFLLDANRARQFWVDPGRHHADVARGCIRYIGEYMDNAPELDLASCQYIRKKWTMHLVRAHPLQELLEDLHEPRFLYSCVPSEIKTVVEWLQSLPSPPQELLHSWKTWAGQLHAPYSVP